MESDPPQRSIRLILKDEEDDDAYVTKTVSFDISGLQVTGGDMILHLEGYDEGILYEY